MPAEQSSCSLQVEPVKGTGSSCDRTEVYLLKGSVCLRKCCPKYNICKFDMCKSSGIAEQNMVNWIGVIAKSVWDMWLYFLLINMRQCGHCSEIGQIDIAKQMTWQDLQSILCVANILYFFPDQCEKCCHYSEIIYWTDSFYLNKNKGACTCISLREARNSQIIKSI